MASIGKINKVLVIEKFNDEINDSNEKEKKHPDSLCIALNDTEDSDNFDYKEVDIEKLKVRSFDEFLRKFAPVIYQGMQSDESGMHFVYSTEKRSDFIPVKFDTISFYKAAVDLYEKKSCSGKANFEFDYSCFSNLLSPKTLLKDIQDQRRQLNYSMMKMLEAKDSHNTAQVDAYKRKVKDIAKSATEKFKDNVTALIGLNIADMEVKLGLTDGDEKKAISLGSTGTAPNTFRIEFNEKGELVKKLISTNVNNSNQGSGLMLTDRANVQVRKLLTSQLTGSQDTEQLDYNQSLLISSFDKDTGLINQELNEQATKELKIRYEKFKSVYSASMDSLLNTVNEIIEKILDVKALFDNAECEITVIVSNSTASELVADGVKDKFAKFIKNYNSNVDEKIWFAVLPQIGDEDLVNVRSSKARIIKADAFVDETEKSDGEPEIIDVEFKDDDSFASTDDDENWDDDDETGAANNSYTSLDTAKQIIGMLSEAKCMTFFGYKGCEATGFGNMKPKTLKEYREKLDGINSEYAVFAYPNFTLMSGKVAGDIEVAHGEHINNPGLYIDAPYVAAGVVLKSLDSGILKKHKFTVKAELPEACVRFDFESDENEYKNRYEICTNMNCEQLLKYDNDLLNMISEKPFGFFFDYYGFYNGSRVKNAFVKCARTFGTKDNRIFATLVKDFIFLEAANGEIRISKAAFDKYKESHKWASRYTEFVNNPLRAGEEYGYKENESGIIKGFVRLEKSNYDNFIDEMEVV
ncbi:MAG: hypothetical protein IJN05_06420 [Ruminococcus sp.]|nr:hypothetical protein [Ruminococcus sp.]